MPKTSMYSPEMLWLRQQLVARRHALGLTQRQLALRMGVVLSFVGKVETGERRMDIIEVLRFCYHLEMNEEETLDLVRKLISDVAKNEWVATLKARSATTRGPKDDE